MASSPLIHLRLGIDPGKLMFWAKRYPIEEDKLVETIISPQVRSRKYYTRSEFLDLCHWKTPRSKKHLEKNSESFIQEVTHIALTAQDQKLRIEVLTLLDGVSWPTASVLLHFGHEEQYPILDFRALWTLGSIPPASGYYFEFWWAYTVYCRELSKISCLSMRVLDRALWQYSKENQGN